jgi:hypothetical protein
MAVRYYHGTFTPDGHRLRLPVARGCPPLWVRLDRDPPYPSELVRSVTLLAEGGRLFVDITAEVPVATYPAGHEPDPSRVAGVDPGVIHPFAAAGPEGQGLLVSGRAIRAEHHVHLRDGKARSAATARRAPTRGRPDPDGGARPAPGNAHCRPGTSGGSPRPITRPLGRVVRWAIEHRIDTLKVGDPRGVLAIKAGRRHNKRVRDWRIGHLIGCLRDKAEQAGITMLLVDERGSSSTCPVCPRHGVIPDGALIAAPHEGLLAGRGPPRRMWGRRSSQPHGTHAVRLMARITQLHLKSITETRQTLSETALALIGCSSGCRSLAS